MRFSLSQFERVKSKNRNLHSFRQSVGKKHLISVHTTKKWKEPEYMGHPNKSDGSTPKIHATQININMGKLGGEKK
jgi:hypothetical protein